MTQPIPDTTSADATREHLDRIAHRMIVLAKARADAFDQLLCALERADLSADEQLEWYEWAQRIDYGAPLISPLRRLSRVLGVSLTELALWSKNGAASVALAGSFPLTGQRLPADGTFAVYLLTMASEVVYIGASHRIRGRLKAHWNGPKREHIDGWQLILCATEAEMIRVEGDLIFQHQPRLNIADKSRRRFRG